MSTAGKVLVVLVTLSLMAWIVLFSAAAQYNTNWGKKLQAQEAQVAELVASQDALATKIEKIKVETSLKQRQVELALIGLRSRLADAEKDLSIANETGTRYKLDLQTVQAQQAEAEAARDRRDRDVADLKTQLAAVQAEVNRTKAENRALLARHGALEKDYVEIAAKNRDLARRAARTVRQTSAR